MQGKKILIWLMLLMLLCAVPAMADTEALRGYVKGDGWQYVNFGEYPYEKNGAIKPVQWRILDITDGQALLMTEYVIDTQQIIFESDQRKIDKGDYRRISSYEESDLYTWMNSEALDTLLGDSPLRGALIDKPGAGKLFILNMMEFLEPDYGFSATKWDNQPSRHAKGTPYAIKSRGLYVGEGGNVSYWAADIKSEEGTRMALVGYNGHLSWGGYTRKNVGLRMSVLLDLSLLEIESGLGTKEKPFVFAYAGEVPPAPEATAVPETAAAPEAAASADATAVPAAQATPVPTEAPADDEILLSFVGDVSIGDSYQYKDYSSCYHATVDDKGYAWPFSLVHKYLSADDLTVANLECVFTERRNHTDKLYNLVADPDHVNVLLEGSIEMVNTVNNHCMDFFEAGYEDTLEVLDKAGINRFGTVYPGQKNGHDDLGVQEIDGVKFGFIGFSYPQDYDQKKIANRIKILREEQDCDVVIVSLHWGRETYMTPQASQVVMAKNIIDAGADAIWGHHPHVIQPILFYKNKPIMFSTGNFTFGTMSQVDPSTGIFQLAYEKVDGQVQLKRLQVIPCETQGNPDYRPFELTDEKERKAVFDELVLKKSYAKCVNPPDSFLETGIVEFENGEMLP